MAAAGDTAATPGIRRTLFLFLSFLFLLDLFSNTFLPGVDVAFLMLNYITGPQFSAGIKERASDSSRKLCLTDGPRDGISL